MPMLNTSSCGASAAARIEIGNPFVSDAHRTPRRIAVSTVRRATLLLTMLLLLVPLLAACGGEGDDDSPASAATSVTSAASPTSGATSPTSPAADASPTEDEASTPDSDTDTSDTLMGVAIEEAGNEGGTFIEGTSSDIQSVSPIIANDTPTANFLSLIFESLVELNPETLEPVGVLAESWEVSDDGLTWTFALREGVRWHDGEAFTADDVKFTYELHMDEASNSSYGGDLVAKIASIAVIDAQTVAFTLPQPYADFAVDVAVYGIIPEHIWADVAPADVVSDPGATGEDPARVVGTGPFVFKEWVTNDRVTASANADYWAGAPYLDEFIFKIVPDSTAAVQQLRTGEIDWFSGVPGTAVEELEGAGIEVTVTETLGFVFYGYNLDEQHTTLFQEPVVRQALLYALDRQALVDAIQEGFGTVAIGTMPLLSWAYNPDGIENPYPYDPDLAGEMLDEAGWIEGSDGVREKDGERLAFTMHADSGNPLAAAYLTAFQEFWAQIGAEMTPQLEPFPALVERITGTYDFDTFLIGFGWGASPDQSAMFACDSYGAGFNVMRYCNEEVDALLSAALAEPDRAERIELYTEYQNLLLEDLPAAILNFPQSIDGYSPRVHNLYPNSNNARFNAETWWVEE